MSGYLEEDMYAPLFSDDTVHWIIICLLFYCSGIYAGLWGAQSLYPITFENYQHKSVQEQVYEQAEKAGVDPVKVMMLIQAESGFDRLAVNKNRNGSWDFGLWQLNNKAHPEISKECAFSVECSTRESLKIIKSRGFREWSANKYLKF